MNLDKPVEPGPLIQQAAESLRRLAREHPDLACSLASFVSVVAQEASQTGRFGAALAAVMRPSGGTTQKRSRRRAPGVLDPFSVHSDTGADGLRDRLQTLDLEQLRDIVAEHGMDHDRLAMKWKDPSRVIERIVDKVSSRAAKGSGFRASGSGVQASTDGISVLDNPG